MNRPDNVTKNDWELIREKYKDLDKVKHKLKNNYPIQYLIGNVNFYGYDIIVNKNVLIPRFETEGLLEETIKLIHKYKLENTQVLDIGTGSGCIPIVLKKEIPEIHVTSVDISRKALKVAKQNAKLHNVDITLINKNIYKYKPINRYGVLISNPPYVAFDEEVDPQIAYEPQNAIYAKDEGLEYYKFILNNMSKYLEKKFIMAFEIGYKQGNYLRKLSKDLFPRAEVFIKKDLAQKDRYLFIVNA